MNHGANETADTFRLGLAAKPVSLHGKLVAQMTNARVAYMVTDSFKILVNQIARSLYQLCFP